MKIELKNIKHAAFASQETLCFTASVYIDGKRVGEVSNEGYGGADRWHPYAIEHTINEYAKTLPPVVYDDFTFQPNAETLVGELMNDWLRRQSEKKLCAKQTCFRKPGESYADGEWHTVKGKYSDAVRDYLINKYGPTVRILNVELQCAS